MDAEEVKELKTNVFLRVGKDGSKYKAVATTNPTQEPLRIGTYRGGRAIPTVFLSLSLEIPDEAFKPPNISASISVPIEKLGTAIEVVDPIRVL